ncbi:ribbon-helix-helix domain-containing protein [Acidobacteria bacterium AH-259-A15]|nr:ribbon-helix-helix domain-containing protein [Acidobacteria bacterium AH-259-A15]
MRITISIDEKMINELMQLEGVRNRSQAIRRAVEAYLRRRRIENFKKLAGSRLCDLDWQKMEQEEIQQLNRDEE